MVDSIDSRIKAYEGSMAELDRMTGRVQENMNRVRDESIFVENAGKKINEAKNKLLDLEKNLEGLEHRFKQENALSLEKTAESMMASVKSLVSDLGATAETIERKVEDHREEISKIEESRTANMARDTEFINKLLSRAVEQAGKRADKMEEAALVSLKQQAEDRILKLKSTEEEKLKNYHENAKARVAEVQSLVKNIREEWRAERNDWETKDKEFREERKKGIEILVDDSRKLDAELRRGMQEVEKQMEELASRANEVVSSQEAMLIKATEGMKQKALEINEAKLEEYRRAQDAEFRRLETLADDSRSLDAELRRSMQEVINRLKEDFSKFERESADMRKVETDKFSAAVANSRKDLTILEKELAELKSEAYENVSGKLKSFEDDFFADLTRRSTEINQRVYEWQNNLDTRFNKIGEEAEIGRQELERSQMEEMKKKLSAMDARLVSELERLKTATGAFEEGIRGQMNAADESVVSFRSQLDQGLEEARKEAEISIRAEFAKHAIASAEIIKQYQRELDEGKNALEQKIRELDDSIEEARRRVRDLATETDSRITSVRTSIEDTERYIREAVDKTKLIDKAEALRLELEKRVEDLKGEIDRLDLRSAEAAKLENDFVVIRRLGDDINAKMTRFLTEQRRIENMEKDFTRLIQISHSVEEKLTHVTASDDTLQGMQLQIRKLEESLGVTEEKYQRIERKNQILDNTNDGIDRNFKALQESEKLSTKIGGDLDRYAEDLDFVKTSIEKLAGESEKAREALDKIEVLENMLEEIEERINSMQRARQWVAEAETRLQQLNKQAQVQARAIDSLVKGKKARPPVDLGEGAPSPQKKENVIALKRQGWTEKEIAEALKMSLGEVELILEMTPRD
jgi:chromosome segregation ATPase